MVAARHFIDNAPTPTLSGAISSGATAVPLSSLVGFPVAFPFEATIDLGTASAEQVLVTANPSGSTLTVTRNVNGLGAFSHPIGATFNHTANALDYQEANDHHVASTAVHGITGAVVGTSDSQTLTNKTLTAPIIATISNGGTITLPTGADTLVGRATTDTLTNKTLNAGIVTGAVIDATSTIDGVLASDLAVSPRGRLAGGTKTILQSLSGTDAMVSGAGGLSDMSFTVVSGRRYKVTLSLNADSTSAISHISISLRDGGGTAPTTGSTAVRVAGIICGNSPDQNDDTRAIVWELVGGTDLSAGGHHLGLSLSASGSGTSLSPSATNPTFCIIEDIGV